MWVGQLARRGSWLGRGAVWVGQLARNRAMWGGAG